MGTTRSAPTVNKWKSEIPREADRHLGAAAPPEDLKGRTVRGGAVTFAGQGIKVALNMLSTVILARLLAPADYGLIGMVTGITGFVETFKDAGLSMATIQREHITNEQISNLFWLNVTLGAGLALVVVALAPVAAIFYGEPRVAWVTVALGSTFLMSGLTVQHQALLRRNMRFKELTIIDIISLSAGSTTAIVMGRLGFRHWALVGMAIVSSLVNAVAVWVVMPWRPGPVSRGSDVRPMIGFGGNIMGSRFMASFVRNTPNILLGWFWGAGAVGLYQRAYSLLMFSIDQIQGPVTAVAIAPLSRIQSDGQRLRRFFLAGYSIVITCILPIVVTSAVFAEGIVSLMLGPQWIESARIFRWLALSGIFVGLMNPQGMLLLAMGRTVTHLKLGVIASLCAVISYILGVRYGAEGIAVSFLLVTAITSVPMMHWTFRNTPVTLRDVAHTIRPPFIACLIAAAIGLTVKLLLAGAVADWVLTLIGCSVMLLTYTSILLFAFRQWVFYRDIVSELIPGRKVVV